MKKQALITTLSFLAVMLIGSSSCSCGNPKKKIEKVAYKYLYAMANYRVDDAVPYCTQETLDGVITQGREMIKNVQAGYIESDTPAKVKILSVDITSDTTAIAHFNKVTPLKEHNGQIDLVYREGKWLVHVLLPSQKRGNKTAPIQQMPESSDTVINGRVIMGFPSQPK